MHRLVAETFISNSDNKPEVNHKDGVKIHNEDYKLEWCTYKENILHSCINGLRKSKGETRYFAKLKEIDILQIRNSSLKQIELAEIYKISQSVISLIKNNKIWKHI